MNYKHFFRKNNRTLAVLILFSLLVLPTSSYAITVVCKGTSVDITSSEMCLIPCGFDTNSDKKLSDDEMCHLSDLVTLVNNFISFILFAIAAPLAVLSLAIGGLLMITARGDTGQLQRGKDIFYNTVIGFVVAFGAWLIVEAVITALVPESGTAFNKLKDYISL